MSAVESGESFIARAESAFDGVLVVEDSDDDVFFLKRAWKRAGMDMAFEHAPNGEEAIRRLSSRNGKLLPKVVLTDLKMPGTSGFDVLKFIQEESRFKGVTVLVWSNSNDIDDMRKSYALGAHCYFPKPNSAEGWNFVVQRLKDFYQR